MNTLIIAEKPSVALRIAIALGNNTQRKIILNGVGYYEIPGPSGSTFIAAAVGHIFTVRQKGTERGYPVLDVEWAASYEVNKASYYTKKYLDVFKMLSQKSDVYINACDFDIEGTVIGTNIIRFLGGNMKEKEKAKRMKFSTTTIPDIKNAYGNLMPLDLNNFYEERSAICLTGYGELTLAGHLQALLRHKVYEISKYRKGTGADTCSSFKKRIEIQKFISKPYWNVLALIKEVEFANVKGDLFEQRKQKEF